MGPPRENWFLERQEHPETKHHLNVLLQSREKITIGRRAGGAVDIVCQGKTVSRSHCVLTFRDCIWHVEDLGSMNGVFLNGALIPGSQPVPLKVGDSLGIGCKDTSESDYHVFTVCKAIVKDENENAMNADSLKKAEVSTSSVGVLAAASDQGPLALQSDAKACTNKPKDQTSTKVVSEQNLHSCEVTNSEPQHLHVQQSTTNYTEEANKPNGTPNGREGLNSLGLSKEDFNAVSISDDAANNTVDVVVCSAENAQSKDPQPVTSTCTEKNLKVQVGTVPDRGETPNRSSNGDSSKHQHYPEKMSHLPKSLGTKVQSAKRGTKPSGSKNTKGRALLKSNVKLDKKLIMKCVVVLARLTEKEIRQHTTLIRRPKLRARPLIVSDDEEDGKDNASLGENCKESRAIQIETKESSRNIKESEVSQPEASTSSTSHNRSKFVIQKLAIPSIEPKIVSPSSYTPAFDGSSDSEEDTFVPISIFPKEDDDYDCIIIDSDDEFIPSTPRIKQESTEVSQTNKADDAQEVLLISDDEEEFFPKLSQPFLDEIAQEEAAEAANASAHNEDNSTVDKPSTGATSGKLDNIVAKYKSKPKEKTTKLTEPKQLDVGRRHTNKRFTLATAGSFIDKLKKDQDLASYSRCVKAANSKNANAPVHPAPEPAQKKIDSSAKGDSGSTRKSISKEKSQGPVPVKAKITKRSRGDLLTAEMVPEGAFKRPSEETGGLSDYTIPKKARVEAAPSAEPPVKEKEFDEDAPIDQIELDQDVAALGPVVQPTFKKPRNRVARSLSDDQRENTMPKPRPDPCQSQAPTNKRDRFQPRSIAIPLGGPKRRNSAPLVSTPQEWRKNREQMGPKPEEANSLPAGGAGLEVNRQAAEEVITGTDAVSMEKSEGSRNSGGGILVYPGQASTRKSTGRGTRISFGEDQIRIIESREQMAEKMREEASQAPPNNNFNDNCNQVVPFVASAAPVQQPAHLPAAGQDSRSFRDQHGRLPPIVESMLARVCNWNYSWIAEQENADEPPPILGSVKCKSVTLPELVPIPVLMAYNSVAQYQEVFFPLMLHEIWGGICKDLDNASNMWKAKALVRENVTSDGASAFVQCEALVPEASARLWEYDLVVMSCELKKGQPRHVFGIVDSVSLRNFDINKEMDKRLQPTCRKPCVRVSITLRMKPSNVPRNTGEVWAKIRRLTSLKTYVKQLTLIAELPSSPLYDVIMDPTRYSDAFNLLPEKLEANYKVPLNAVQRRAVTCIADTVLQCEKETPKVALLQGPPGTGKSHVIVQLVLRLLTQHYAEKKKMPRILICAPSNNAIDEIALRLINTTEYKQKRMMVVRVGVPSAINPNLKEIAAETLAKAEHIKLVANRISDVKPRIEMVEKELETLEKTKQGHYCILSNASKSHDQDNAKLVARKLQEVEERIESMKKTILQFKEEHAQRFYNEMWRAKEAVIGQANVICTTLNSCRNRDMENVFRRRSKEGFQNPEILCCIIDEASQCTEPESLTPLSLGVSKLVLIGDPDQLPATVCSQFAQRLRFDQSLFNRFFSARTTADPTNSNSVMMLDTQYRMSDEICKWPSKYFYGNKLKTDTNLVRQGPGALIGRLYQHKVLNVYDGEELVDSIDGNARSIMNPKEAKVVAGIIQALATVEPNIHKHVGVITFYQRQKSCIIDTLRKGDFKLKGDVEVNTVDGFQGQEKDIIIVSCVRANRDVGFLGSLQRMNVALTRARHSLFVVGHFDTLNTNEAWRDLITEAKNRGHCHTITSDYVLGTFENLILKKQH